MLPNFGIRVETPLDGSTGRINLRQSAETGAFGYQRRGFRGPRTGGVPKTRGRVMKAAERTAGSCHETAPSAAEHPENSRSLAPRLWRHGCLFLACVVLTLGVRAALKHQHADERRRLELAARARRTAEIAALWNRLTYADLAAPETTSRFLTAVDWRSLRLSTTQEVRLRTRLAEVVAYLRQPTVAGYLRLKTEGLHPTFAPTRWPGLRPAPARRHWSKTPPLAGRRAAEPPSRRPRTEGWA